MRLGSLRILGALVVLVVAGSLAASGAQAARTAKYIPSEQIDFPTCSHLRPIADAYFPKKPTAKNKWLPMKVGTQYVLEGRSNRGGGALPHSITFTVTNLTKVINGVTTRVLWDVDVNSGILIESELSFFVEDGRGNVWLFGEYPEEYEGGILRGAPNTWLGGIAASEPGVIVPAYPKLSGPAYIQAFAPSVGFFDCGKDIIKEESACVPVGCFNNNVLVVEEWNPNDPGGAFQRKLYAPGVGNIQVGAVNDPEGETLVMGAKRTLSASELKQANAEALKLDERAYLISEVYRQTEPAQPGGRVPPIPPPPARVPPAVAPTGTVPPVVQNAISKPKTTKKKRKKSRRCASKRKRAGAKAKGKGKSSKRKRCGARRRPSSRR